MEKNKFKKGDIVEFRPGENWNYAASEGAKARVTKVGDGYLYVKWIDKKSNGQENGGYSFEKFYID